MNIPTYHINAFANHVFAGNPAMVCILDAWLPDATLQLIATENNLPATVFLVREGKDFSTRWFSPEYEIDLCGHGTLASGFVIFNVLEPFLQKITLHSPKGSIELIRNNEFITLALPVKKIEPISFNPILEQGLGLKPKEIYEHTNERCLAMFDTEEEIKQIKPDMSVLKQLPYRGIIITAPGNTCEFVSRVFYPMKAMSEDAVTGASHCLLVPYWAEKLNKTKFLSRQLSQRGGELSCELQKDKVLISGTAVLYNQGTIANLPYIH